VKASKTACGGARYVRSICSVWPVTRRHHPAVAAP
jgi:hypothetical protein